MKTKALLMSTAAFLTFGNIAFARVWPEICRSEWDKGPFDAYKSEFRCSEKACSQNDGRGCFILGMLYSYELGVEQDTKQAITYYKKGCSLNDGMACDKLGFHYEQGVGVRQDKKQAITYYEKACSLNEGNSCVRLGELYYNGWGVEQNKKVSKEYFGKACDLGFQLGGCDEYRKLNEQGY